MSWKRKEKRATARKGTCDEVSQISALKLQIEQVQSQYSKNIQSLFLEILEAIDAFDRVFTSIRDKGDELTTEQMKLWLGNFRTIRRLLERALTDRDVRPIDGSCDGFDPARHQVYETKGDTSEPDGTILEEVQKGYMWHGQVLRKAQVVVALSSTAIDDSDTSNAATLENSAPPHSTDNIP